MPRFHFRLKPLLTARKQAERLKQLAVAELERLRRGLEDGIHVQQRAIVSGKETQRSRLVGSLDLRGLRAHAAATIQHMRQAHRLVIELAGVQRRLEAARAELIEAAKNRRAIELLRDRRFEAWRAQLDKAEDNALDELVTQNARRKEP